MVQHTWNPFVTAGSIISGTDFTGRRNELETITSRVILPEADKQRGSLVIVGLPKIGKWSLVYQLLLSAEQKAELQERKLLPIAVNLEKYQQPEIFFYDLVKLCRTELERLKWSNNAIRGAARTALKEGPPDIDRIQEFFRRVRRAGFSVIFILSKFDSAITLFNKNPKYYQWLRDLAYYPDWQVAWVMLARRTLHDIEMRMEAVSTLDGILLEQPLAMFDEEHDAPDYYHQLAAAGVQFKAAHKSEIRYYCGEHPYLMAVLGNQLVMMYGHKEQDVNITVAARAVEQKFRYYYDKVIELLREDKKLAKLAQVLFGPIYGLEQTDIDELCSYGLIKLNPHWTPSLDNTSNAYIAFSEHFQSYLQSKIENMSRCLLIEQAEQDLHTIINMAQSKKGTRDRYKYHGSSCQIILTRWQTFEPLFHGRWYDDRDYWLECAEVLDKMSQPLRQPRIDKALKACYADAQNYCEGLTDIAKILTEAEDAQSAEQLQNAEYTSFDGHTIQVGQRLCGYKVTAVPTRTGHSQVVRAYDDGLARYVALKLFYQPHGMNDVQLDEYRQNLRREARILAKLRHKHIGTVHNFHQNPPAIELEWIEGKSLYTVLQERNRLQASDVVRMSIKLTEALNCAHTHEETITHRDIKPNNIILKNIADSAQINFNEPILIDFDVARVAHATTIKMITAPEDFVGSPDYSAPEQFALPGQVGPKADIFALGVVMYEAMIGLRHYPYRGNDLRIHGDHFPYIEPYDIPIELYTIICTMLHHHPHKRPDALQLHEQLELYLKTLS